MKIQKIDDSKDQNILILIASALILVAVFSRLLPHPPNFTSIAAVAIFGGAVLPRRWALSLPVAAMIMSDIIIGFHPLVLLIWASFVAIAFLSSLLIRQAKPPGVVGASFGASIFFYLVSNFGVWLEGRMYPMTLPGLMDSYYMALPFFRNTLLGDLVFTGLLFGVYALVSKLVSVKVHPLTLAVKS